MGMALPLVLPPPAAPALHCPPPFSWPAMLAYLGLRATPGVEAVRPDGGRYRRGGRRRGRTGHIAVRSSPDGRALLVETSASLQPVVTPLAARLRRLFDLDADSAAVDDHLARDPRLAPLVARRPGLQVPGTLDGFELALRAVLGQAVTVRGASTLAGRLAALVGEPLPDPPPGLERLPVSAERLAETRLEALRDIGLTRGRAQCVLALARAAAAGELPELAGHYPAGDPTGFIQRLTQLPGIGPWTASYVAMRALGWRDAFPEGDLGLRQAVGGLSPARLRAASERWRPWRAYAAQHLWASLADSGRLAHRSPLPDTQDGTR